MKNLRDFIKAHTDENSSGKASADQKIVRINGASIACKNVDAPQFKTLVAKNIDGQISLSPFDGCDHDMIEIGQWLGDESLAPLFTALAITYGFATHHYNSKNNICLLALPGID